MPTHSSRCAARRNWQNRCDCYLGSDGPKDKRIADKILLRIKAIDDERDSLYAIIGQCVVQGMDYSEHLTAVTTANARIDELQSVLKDIDALS